MNTQYKTKYIQTQKTFADKMVTMKATYKPKNTNIEKLAAYINKTKK